MALDHYVSQVYLKNWYSGAIGNRLNVIRKAELKKFTQISENVCRIEDGSTTPYLEEPRAIEDFLKSIEPKYNSALAKIRARQIDSECIHTIAGFAAYIVCCTPAAKRIHTGGIKAHQEATAILMDEQGLFPPPPAELGGATLTELLESGKINIEIDERFPQALGISTLIDRLSLWGNSPWDILIIRDNENEFFTSDFPCAIETCGEICNQIIPLAPDIAVRIRPDVRLRGHEVNLAFTNFSADYRKVDYDEIRRVNTLLVQCAEDMVFFRDDKPWIQKFIEKNKFYHVGMINVRKRTTTGFKIFQRQKIIEQKSTQPERN
jgi:hypothetical protein